MSQKQKNPPRQGQHDDRRERTGKNDSSKKQQSGHDPDSPEKKIQIDDNPGETEKKIPHMKK